MYHVWLKKAVLCKVHDADGRHVQHPCSDKKDGPTAPGGGSGRGLSGMQPKSFQTRSELTCEIESQLPGNDFHDGGRPIKCGLIV